MDENQTSYDAVIASGAALSACADDVVFDEGEDSPIHDQNETGFCDCAQNDDGQCASAETPSEPDATSEPDVEPEPDQPSEPEPDAEPDPDQPSEPDPDAPPVPRPPSPRQALRAATRATKLSLIAQAELVAMTAPASTAAAEMKALFERWKQAGRTTKAEDDALWAQFTLAQDQLHTRLSLLREQRTATLAEATRAKLSLIATAEEVAERADLKQAAETMAALMAQWKQVGQGRDDQQLWQRFKAAQDKVYARRTQDRRQSEADQSQSATLKRSIIAQIQGLVGAPDIRQAGFELRTLQTRFRQAGYAGRDLNKKLSNQFDKACQEFSDWAKREPGRRKESGEVTTYDRRTRLVRQLEQVRADLAAAEEKLKQTDASGARRSHGSSITLLLGQSGAYSGLAAETMRLKVQLTDLEKQLTRLDSSLGRA